MMYSPDGTHRARLESRPLMAFDDGLDFETQKAALEQKLTELLGEPIPVVPLNPVIEETVEHERYTEYRIRFDVEEKVQAICLLCIPFVETGKKVPLVICLQGHGRGMHVSMGRRAYECEGPDTGDRDCAVQALERGYAALCLDQRGMGERRTVLGGNPNDSGAPRCHVTAMNALMVGRTMVGERCHDVSRAIDMALTFDAIDPDRIVCTGNSGGGTTTFDAACMDERIKVAMPSCAVCTYKHSIGAMNHCVCNFIPNVALYADMGDLAALIAPRKLVLIHGIDDPIFPKDGVLEAYQTIEKIYAAAGVPQNCTLATGGGGHRYYKAEAWDGFERVGGFGS
jgi:dienelactone hydrolase